jgi:hypothetical protein
VTGTVGPPIPCVLNGGPASVQAMVAYTLGQIAASLRKPPKADDLKTKNEASFRSHLAVFWEILSQRQFV